MTAKLIFLSIFIPMQIMEKDVFQYDGILVSSVSNPVFPASNNVEGFFFVAPEIRTVVKGLFEEIKNTKMAFSSKNGL